LGDSGNPTASYRWAILTGEYPPQAGGVSDFTRLTAEQLAAAGDEVHVWAPPADQPELSPTSVTVHRLPDRFGPRSLWRLHRDLAALPRPFRLLVQYVPQAFGFKGMNLPFALWVAGQPIARPEVLFHEFAVWPGRGLPFKTNVIGWVTHVMATLLANRASRILVATPAWSGKLRRFAPGCRPVWQPIPSTIGEEAPAETAEIRGRLLGPDGVTTLVGHFSAYGAVIVPGLRDALAELLTLDAGLRVVLIGRGSDRFRSEFLATHPQFTARLVATGGGDASTITAHIAACDVMMQPFPSGVTTRNTSVTVSLALGRALVTSQGPLTEPMWHDEGIAVLTPANNGRAMAEAVVGLARNPLERVRLCQRAAELYRQRFALDVAVAHLREPPASACR